MLQYKVSSNRLLLFTVLVWLKLIVNVLNTTCPIKSYPIKPAYFLILFIHIHTEFDSFHAITTVDKI